VTLNIIAGPRTADQLTWWQVGGISPTGELVGWVAETAPNGVPLMQHPPKLPGTNIPDPITGVYLGAPFRRRFGISQLWGENPQIYGQFTYDGVPLQGHNGIDFLTPTGTELLAVDHGQVLEVIYYDLSGFGHYIKVQHSWGEAIYAHMDTMVVTPGATVMRGDLIGYSDNTGYSGGPHLHFAIRINPYERTDGWGGFSDPLPYLNPDDFELPPYVLPSHGPSAAPAPSAAVRALPAAPTRWDGGVGMAPDHPNVVRP
jgi:murein DD-endopeptidase MepM/ murein hydrolase activator NlpD